MKVHFSVFNKKKVREKAKKREKKKLLLKMYNWNHRISFQYLLLLYNFLSLSGCTAALKKNGNRLQASYFMKYYFLFPSNSDDVKKDQWFVRFTTTWDRRAFSGEKLLLRLRSEMGKIDLRYWISRNFWLLTVACLDFNFLLNDFFTRLVVFIVRVWIVIGSLRFDFIRLL